MKNRLLENDIKKIKSIIDYKIGKTISEQEEKGCLPKGTNDRGATRIGPLKPTGSPGVYEITAIGEFPAGVSKNPGIVTKFINDLEQKITESNEVDTETNNVSIFAADIYSSASNERNGPVKATHSNKGWANPKSSPYTHPEDDSFFTGDQAGNEKLAADRGVNLWNELKSQLGSKKGLIRIIMSSRNGGEPEFQSWVTDTGGCVDDRRDTSKYPNPGQIVKITAKIQLLNKAADEQRKCLTGMQITLGYYCPEDRWDKLLAAQKKNNKLTPEMEKAINTERERSNKINQGRVSINSNGTPGGHTCDKAIFEIWMNGVRVGSVGKQIGRINLNNAAGEGDPMNPINGVKVVGGSREGTLTVTPREAVLVSNRSEEGIEPGFVNIYIKGVLPNSHNDVPWVKIVSGQGKVLMNKQADDVEGYNAERGKTGLQKLFGPFDPCELIN